MHVILTFQMHNYSLELNRQEIHFVFFFLFLFIFIWKAENYNDIKNGIILYNFYIILILKSKIIKVYKKVFFSFF